MQIPAPPELSLFIKHYLFINVKTGNLKKYRLFSNGNPVLVVVIEGNTNFKNNKGITTSGLSIIGQFTQFVDFEFSTDTKLLVIVFQPYGLFMLTRVPGTEMQNLILDAELVFGK